MVKNKVCEVCGDPAMEEFSLRDQESSDSFIVPTIGNNMLIREVRYMWALDSLFSD